MLITRSPDHQYTFEGITYPGVTSILKVLDKSGPLMSWASRMTAEAAVRLVGTLPQLIEVSGPDGAVKALTARSGWVNEGAKDLGTLIHDLADRSIRGEDVIVPEHAKRRLDHYLAWWAASGWKLRCSEGMLINPEKGYGGTLDLLCYDRDGATVLADIKSGKIDYRGQVYDSIILQLAAYGDAEWLETGDVLYAMPDVHRYVVIQVAEDGIKQVDVHIGRDELAAFGACLTLTNWRQTLKGMAL